MTTILNNISDAYIGNHQIKEIWYSSTKIWPNQSHDYSQDYLTIESLEDNNEIYINEDGSDLVDRVITIQYSIDNGITWNSKSIKYKTYITTLNTGDKLLLKGTQSPAYTSGDYTQTHNFLNTKSYIVYGNIMSILYGDNFINQTTLQSNTGFGYLFSEGASLHHIMSAENLILPAMILSEGCYDHLFNYCENLTKAPILPAKNLVNKCYYSMFQRCKNLNYVKCYAIDISATDCLKWWLDGVSSTGTFYKDANTTYPSGIHGIPSGWTIQNL